MRKIYLMEELDFTLYNESSSIIYNDEKTKNKVINSLFSNPLFIVINTKTISYNIRVSDFLKLNDFNMKYVPRFNIENILSKSISSLKLQDKIFIKVLITITNFINKYVVFDDVLSYLSPSQKTLVMDFLNEKQVLFFNFTSNVEELVYSKYLIVLSKNKVAIEGKTNTVLNEEKLLKRLGFSLPFTVDLSNQLKSYGIVDKCYYDLDRLVNDLWN